MRLGSAAQELSCSPKFAENERSPSHTSKAPAYTRLNALGWAVLRLDGRDHYLGSLHSYSIATSKRTTANYQNAFARFLKKTAE